MSARQQSSDSRTSSGNDVSATSVKLPEVQPDVSIWDLREVKESWWGKAIRTVVRGAVPFGVICVSGYSIRAILRTDGMDNGFKIVGVIAIIQTLVILGMATLLAGAKTDAKTSKDYPDQSADP